MAIRALLAITLMVAMAGPAIAGARAKPGRVGRLALVRHDETIVFARPTDGAAHLAVLVEQTQVRVLSTRGGWAHVSIWASVRGWVHRRDLVYRRLVETTSTYSAPPLRYPLEPAGPFRVSATAVATSILPLATAPGRSAVAYVTSGSRVRISAWRQDVKGQVWYRVRGLWALSKSVRFAQPDPATARSGGKLLWRRASGKGMWLTLGTAGQSDPHAIVQAARSNGITHFYVEAAVSPLGFHGKTSVGPLLHAAHRGGIAVLAWVYPYLYDIASDVALTRQVAAYRSAAGDRFDGIAADLERNMRPWRFGAYSQLVRQYLGPRYLLVGVTYPPQDLPSYPFAEVGRSYNLVAPMDYWHQTKSHYGLNYGRMAYGYRYGRRFAAESILSIRRAGVHVPIAPIGQVFDNFGKLEMGPHAPSAGEIRGFLDGSKRSGAVGVSFFQWMTATDGEWREIKAYRY